VLLRLPDELTAAPMIRAACNSAPSSELDDVAVVAS